MNERKYTGNCENCAFCPQAGKCPAQSQSADPRETMRRLCPPVQWLITELTGKALLGQVPPFRWTPGGRFLLSIVVMALGMILSALALISGGAAWLLLLPGWLLTVSAMRAWQTSFVHHAAHGNFLQPAAFGDTVAELISTLIWIQPLSGYRPDHVLHHAKTATTDDADLRFLIALGFVPGLTERDYRRKLRRMIVSPAFHLKYAWFRLRANFVAAPLWRRVAAVAWSAAMILLTMAAPLPAALLWLIPAWPIYQVAGLLQLLTEHNWVRIGDGRDKRRMVLARLTNARFFGEPLPPAGAGGINQIRWWLRLAFVHLPQRLFVAQGDLPNHDWHHRESKGDWANAPYARRDSAGDTSWPIYSEVWGTGKALSRTFLLLAALPRTAKLGKPLTYGELKDTILGM